MAPFANTQAYELYTARLQNSDRRIHPVPEAKIHREKHPASNRRSWQDALIQQNTKKAVIVL